MIPSVQHNLTMHKATGLIFFLLFDITLPQDVLIAVHKIQYHGLTPLCVVILTTNYYIRY